MRILLDHNVPHGLRRLLPDWDMTTVAHLDWQHLRNGELLAAAEQRGFDILITGDKNLRYQQNLPGRLTVLVLDSTRWRVVRSAVSVIEQAVAQTSGDHAAPRLRRLALLGGDEAASAPSKPSRR